MIRIIPSEDSVIRLVGAVLMEIDEAWTTGDRYFDMAEYWEWRADVERQGASEVKSKNHSGAA